MFIKYQFNGGIMMKLLSMITRFFIKENVLYVNGSDVLLPPLEME